MLAIKKMCDINEMGLFLPMLIKRKLSVQNKHAVRLQHITLSKSLISTSLFFFKQPDDNFVNIFSS